MIGTARPEQLRRDAGARPGDALILPFAAAADWFSWAEAVGRSAILLLAEIETS